MKNFPDLEDHLDLIDLCDILSILRTSQIRSDYQKEADRIKAKIENYASLFDQAMDDVRNSHKEEKEVES